MKLTINTQKKHGTINPKLHGQFIEFLGDCIDNGIWVGRNSEIPNVDGLRLEVVESLKALEPPVLRWPGGCYADTYHWRDGIGDPAKRPVTFNENFGTYQLDPHQFGTDEFMKFCDLIGAEPWININLLSGTVREMQEWLEYCNRQQPISLAAERRQNGHTDPYDVKYLGIGNEVWGGGGFMTPQQYAAKYREYALAVPTFKTQPTDDDTIYKIASGPDGNKPRERVAWTKALLQSLASYRQPAIDALDLHFYNWNIEHPADTPTQFSEDDWFRVIDQAQELDDVLTEQETLIAEGLAHMPIPESSLDQRLTHLDLVVGEWGNWHRTAFTAQPALFQQVTMRDAITTAVSLNILQSHCETVTMACVAQTVNVLNSLILTDGPATVLTPNYDVFMLYKGHRNGHVLELNPTTSSKTLLTFASIKENVITLSVINTDLANADTLSINFEQTVTNITAQTLHAAHMTDYNSATHPDLIRRQDLPLTTAVTTNHTLSVPAASVSTF